MIARIVVFKDDRLATAKPDMAVKRNSGAIFKDQEGSGWTDPFNQEAWRYNIAIAVEAATLGFDEIQFDYLRFPDASGLVFARPNTMDDRIEPLSPASSERRAGSSLLITFSWPQIYLDTSRGTWTTPTSVRGYRSFHQLSITFRRCFIPLVSSLAFPATISRWLIRMRVVFRSLQNAHERTGIAPIRFRPWLQAFRDYAFDRRTFGGTEIKAQIAAAEDFGTDGWMLWNPHNIYSSAGLENDPPVCVDSPAK